ncbi:disulfide bond formation protein DsbA [Streptomyces sp. NBC_01775]|uniref:mycothiol-dependent nitroreductase Rv2466c family protein n=1 Tax=Streptomyces sp. NBC_01775 TaxID=2975939 RepID=UPI002DDBA7D3|nr:disulfide bond formation protein DsbA [Streptomyces sp. NBC_01775]WSB80228.1 disulfide bond formation protein DsbA [Streptomyces sp. NBC_01775]
MTVVDFWFDPSCPYTWLTSRWIREVERVREVEVRWRVMSLSVLNEHLDEDPEGDTEGYLWMPVRVCAAVAEEHGQRALGDFFTAFGTRVHTRSDWDWGRVLPEALAEAGLPAGLADAAGSERYDAAVRASHAEGIGLVGTEVGTPVLAVSGQGGERTAFFGPCVSPTPCGETAGRLWDGALLMAGVEQFYEFRRAASPLDFRECEAAGRRG